MVKETVGAVVGGGGAEGPEKTHDTHDIDGVPKVGEPFLNACAKLRSLKELCDGHKSALKSLNAIKSELQLELARTFIKNGMQNTTFDGMTFYLRTDLFVNKVEEVTQDELCDALEGEAEWKEYSGRRCKDAALKAHVRELLDEATPGTDPMNVLPEGLRPYFKASRIPAVIVKKA